ncbi:MAG: hypothetical protein MSC30_18660, partial [Gaiellaceae bacterium MAG52_C11]|nr:hypothetical protein [Candidatus Gaiellasilicea maunaloa]
AARAAAPYLVLGADTVFASGEVGRFLRAFESSGAAGAIAVRRCFRGGPGRNGVGVVDGRVERVHATASPFAGAPLWAVGESIAAVIETLPGAPPFELATAFQQAIDAGEPVAAIEIEPTRDLTAPIDLLLENFPYLSAL